MLGFTMPASRTLTSVLLCSLALSIGECSDGGRRSGSCPVVEVVVRVGVGLGLPTWGAPGLDPASLKEGDLIFHRPNSSQSEAIQIATSRSSIMWELYFNIKGRLWCLRQYNRSKLPPLPRFIERGNHHFVIADFDGDRVLSAEVIARMKALGQGYLGKNYDLQFRWSDERIYCSELVWKLYKQGAGD